VENAGLIKRVPVPRMIIPVANVLGCCVHMSAQVGLLLLLVIASGLGVNRHWPWLIFIWAMAITFVTGLSLVFSALNVYVRDVRYVVESSNLVLFWLVPVFYPFSKIPQQFREIYQLNPIAALVLASRNVLLEGIAPPSSLLIKLAISSTLMLVVGALVFQRLQSRFYNYL
jgi:lipopolysaccharide transport system permease protein